MLMKTLTTLFSIGVALCLLALPAAHAAELQSPDGNIAVTFDVRDDGSEKGRLFYSVAWRGKPIIAESQLGFTLKEGPALAGGFKIVRLDRSSHDETWKPVYGERSSYRDHYNQLVVELQEAEAPRRQMSLTFRAYNEGAAFCHTLPKQPAMERVSIAKENTEFRFTADHTTWAVYSAQGNYAKVALSQLKPGCERPTVVQIADDCYAAIGEAKLVDYARMKFAPLAGTSSRRRKEADSDSPAAKVQPPPPHVGGYGLVSDLTGGVEAALPLTTPWRFVMAADSPGRLLENNFLLLNLNDPCAIADTSWIKPGKVIREVTLTTTGGKACVDFAVKRGLQYVEFDAGWYGHEYDDASDASAVNVDPKRSKGPLDLQAVIAYAKQRGIGIILYVNRRALEKQLDQILPLYRKWGVAGVKYGFVNVGTQQWTAWLHDAVRKAAAHQLMVDIHDEYRPTGYSRTYPNLMTQEGIAGDETSPANTNTLTILFSRLLCGAADNTICYYDARVDRLATHAYQLAKAVCLYSPWQFLYWYDRPPAAPAKTGGAGGGAPTTGDEPELEFYNAVPTAWDDTRVIHGRIGEFAVIARRSGAEWFIGGMNSGEARTLDVPLGFLARDKKYIARIYSDDPSVPTRTRVKVLRRPVDAGTVLKLTMSAQGGQAIRIAPAEDEVK
ncbi:MAG: glycoside hydrolase family 97 N-terminal domain-containing protein [Verrucomicrobia bacterium]|nr:glycoside hydrolase family 97 N-terminal domain-containing protein [Verrucomicrobiota bacterium]